LIVQDILQTVGGFADGISFGLTPGVAITSYALFAGETAKLGGVTYV
jgi:hypothetical protein